MPHHDLDLSDFEHSRTPGRIAAGVVAAGGLALCILLVFAVLHADEGVYTQAERREMITMGVALILAVSGFIAAIPLTARKRVRVDFEKGTVGTESSVLGFVRHKELPLSSDGQVVHREKHVSTGEGEQTVWVVEYTCRDGSVELHRRPNAVLGRAWAERFAGYLDVPLMEVVEGVFTVRSAEDLDRSVIEQGLADGLEWPDQRISDRLRWVEGPEGDIEITITPPGFGWSAAVGIAFVLGCIALIPWFLNGVEGDWHLGTYISLLILLAVVVVAGFFGLELIVASAFRVERWTVDRHGLGPTETLSTRLPASMIEEVIATADGSLSVRTDGGAQALGSHLKKSELRSLRRVVLLALRGGD